MRHRWFTATSSRATSSSPAAAWRRSRTSVSPAASAARSLAPPPPQPPPLPPRGTVAARSGRWRGWRRRMPTRSARTTVGRHLTSTRWFAVHYLKFADQTHAHAHTHTHTHARATYIHIYSRIKYIIFQNFVRRLLAVPLRPPASLLLLAFKFKGASRAHTPGMGLLSSKALASVGACAQGLSATAPAPCVESTRTQTENVRAHPCRHAAARPRGREASASACARRGGARNENCE